MLEQNFLGFTLLSHSALKRYHGITKKTEQHLGGDESRIKRFAGNKGIWRKTRHPGSNSNILRPQFIFHINVFLG